MLNSAILTGIILLSIWTMIWKGIALWKAGRNNQLAWFLAMFIFNTAGILPIIYLAGFQKKKKKRK
ncbi:hypothetical protein B6U93_03080 [Candidatus Woesearchaeota archaeon ex4484_78]|nr:MAG: hypothetical protein B6U93_03080 [Candidatus Woesearchaeota archaeon ex4484_78]